MFIKVVKFRKTQGAAQVVWSTGIYTALWLGNVLKWQSGKQGSLEHIMMKISVT